MVNPRWTLLLLTLLPGSLPAAPSSSGSHTRVEGARTASRDRRPTTSDGTTVDRGPWTVEDADPVPPTVHRLRSTVRAQPAPSTQRPAPSAVVLLLAPGLSLADLDDPRLPELRSLGQTASVALMNVTMAAWRTDLASACLTLGAGVRMAAPPGFAPTLDGSRLDPRDLARLRAEATPRDAWGQLGATFRQRGGHIGLVVAPGGPTRGATVASARPARPVAPSQSLGAELLLAVIDREGAVPEVAATGPLLRRAPERPYGVAADVTAASTAAKSLIGHCNLVAVDPGDLERARQYAPLCLPARAAAHRRAALGDLDRLLGELRPTVAHESGTLVVVSPVAAGDLPFGIVLVTGPEWPTGLLTSSATRTPGLVTNTDFLVTLAGRSGHSRPGYRATGSGSPEDLRRLATASRRVEAVRPAAWGILRATLLCLALIAALPRAWGLARRLAPLPLLLPLALLLAGDLVAPPSRQTAVAHGAVVALALIGVVILILRRRIPRAMDLATEVTAGTAGSRPAPTKDSVREGGLSAVPAVTSIAGCLAGATTALLLVDLGLGGHLLRWSPLGSSLSLGARYYGIGNEAAGVLLGNALLLPFAVAAGWPGAGRFAPRLGLVLYAVVAFALGSPSRGANFGAALAAVAAAALALPRLFGRRVALRHLAAALAAAGVCAVLLALWDATRPPEAQTHLGRLVAEVRAHGVAPLLTAVAGKASTGLRVASGLWGVLVVLQAGVGITLLRSAQRSGPLHDGLALLVSAAVALILFNDSGAIAAALALAPLPTLAVLLVERRGARDVGPEA